MVQPIYVLSLFSEFNKKLKRIPPLCCGWLHLESCCCCCCFASSSAFFIQKIIINDMLWQWLRSDRYSSAVICRLKKFTTMFLFHWIMGYSINKITPFKDVGVLIKFHQDVYANLKIFLRCAHQKAEVVKFVMCEISGRC